jgi:hypothetical protein
MTKQEFLDIKKQYDSIKKLVYETATEWMKSYQGEGNTYGYKVGNLYITDESIVFQIYHHDGIYPRDYHTVPLDFIFDSSGIKKHAEDAKAEYSKNWKEDYAIEEQIKDLQKKLHRKDFIPYGINIPSFRFGE